MKFMLLVTQHKCLNHPEFLGRVPKCQLTRPMFSCMTRFRCRPLGLPHCSRLVLIDRAFDCPGLELGLRIFVMSLLLARHEICFGSLSSVHSTHTMRNLHTPNSVAGSPDTSRL